MRDAGLEPAILKGAGLNRLPSPAGSSRNTLYRVLIRLPRVELGLPPYQSGLLPLQHRRTCQYRESNPDLTG